MRGVGCGGWGVGCEGWGVVVVGVACVFNYVIVILETLEAI